MRLYIVDVKSQSRHGPRLDRSDDGGIYIVGVHVIVKENEAPPRRCLCSRSVTRLSVCDTVHVEAGPLEVLLWMCNVCNIGVFELLARASSAAFSPEEDQHAIDSDSCHPVSAQAVLLMFESCTRMHSPKLLVGARNSVILRNDSSRRLAFHWDLIMRR